MVCATLLLLLAYKVMNGTFLLNDFLNHGEVRHQIQLRNIGHLRIPLYTETHSELFVLDRAINTWKGLSVTCAAHHHTVVLRLNYDNCKSKVFYGQEPPVENLLQQNVGSIINYLQ